MPLMTVRSQVANWSSRGLLNSLTAKFSKSCNYYTVFNYSYTKPNLNPIEYWKCTNSIFTRSQLEWLYTPNFKSNILATWLVQHLTQPVTWWTRVGLSVNRPVTHYAIGIITCRWLYWISWISGELTSLWDDQSTNWPTSYRPFTAI